VPAWRQPRARRRSRRLPRRWQPGGGARHLNAIAPSIIDTPANRTAMPKADHAVWPKPEEVAATIAFLAHGTTR
jgi:NAD(P)-dependent dehydrogenase (short-subunit alcohol dehydrogenase family)